MGIIAFLSAISISAVAALYSILGLAAIFAGAKIPIMIMGGVLEVGKLVTASWLYQNWKSVPKVLKYYLTSAVVILMFITSMGIFGYLSKSHIDAGTGTSELYVKLERLDSNIESEKKDIYEKYQASLIDMESEGVQKVCIKNKIPFVAIKVVLDDSDTSLPEDLVNFYFKDKKLKPLIIISDNTEVDSAYYKFVNQNDNYETEFLTFVDKKEFISPLTIGVSKFVN